MLPKQSPGKISRTGGNVSLSGIGVIEAKKRGICNRKKDGAINFLAGNLSIVALSQVDYILIVLFFNVSYLFLQREQNQLECETSSDASAP
jgi:hypothetical protein